MKIRRILCTILALIMVVGCFGAISVSADTLANNGTVYVDATNGDDTKDGLITANAVKTLGKATEIIAAANVEKATVSIIGEYDITGSSNFTEAAHPSTEITYTGNDATAVLKFSKQFVMNGPVVFKDLQINPGGKRIYHQGYKLVMDTGLTMTTANSLRVEAGYGNAATINGVDVTINSGSYAHVTVTDLQACTVAGDVNVTINGADTNIAQLHIGGSDVVTNGVAKAINGKTNVTINAGTVKMVKIGCEKSGETTTFGDLVYIKINGGGLAGGGHFGGNSSCAATTFSKGCIVDFSGYVDQGNPEDGANFLLAKKWKSMLNAAAPDETFKAAFKVTDVAATGMQTSAVTDNKTNARFLVGLRDYDHVKATIQVVAKYNDGTGDKQLTFTKAITNVYTSVQAGNGNATTTAADEGANYLIALTIKDVPTNVGDITFEVTPITITNDGEPVNGPTSTFVYEAPSVS